MKHVLSLLLIVVTAGSGCVAFPTKREPKLDKPRRAAELPWKPTIRLVVDDHTSRQERNAETLDRVCEKFPYLSRASANVPDPDYTIRLTVDHAAGEAALNELAFYMILIIPAIYTDEVTVSATVTDAEGKLVGSVSSSGRLKRVAQLHLLWALPITAPVSAGSKGRVWRRSFRDALIQASRLIEENQRAEDAVTALSAAKTPSS